MEKNELRDLLFEYKEALEKLIMVSNAYRKLRTERRETIISVIEKESCLTDFKQMILEGFDHQYPIQIENPFEQKRTERSEIAPVPKIYNYTIGEEKKEEPTERVVEKNYNHRIDRNDRLPSDLNLEIPPFIKR